MSAHARPGFGPVLLLTGLACLGGAASTTASDEPAVAIVSLGESVEILGGTRETGGDPMRPPVFTWHASRENSGSWGALRPLAPPAAGLPFALRGSPWRLETAGFSRGESIHHRLLPLSGELGLVGGRVEPFVDVTRVRVAAVDAWTIVVVEQAAGGAILMRRITADGPSLEMNVAEQFDWPTGWPEGTTLIDIDASVEQLFAWGRDASGGIHVSTFPPGTLPSLALAPDARVAGALLREGPAVIALAAGTLQIHLLGTDGWRAGDAVPWPMASVPGAPSEIVARGVGGLRDVLVVAVADAVAVAVADAVADDTAAANGAPALTVATRGAQGWSLPVRLAIANATPSPLEPLTPPGDAPGDEPPIGLAHRAMLAGAALTSLVALAVMISHFRALRRRRGELQQD